MQSSIILGLKMIPGRALMINVPWQKGRVLTILNIYAPSTPQERDEMCMDKRER
jgi:hypothetical protein